MLFTLRDFNEAMLDMQEFELRGRLCGAEKDGGKRGEVMVWLWWCGWCGCGFFSGVV